MCIFAHPVYEVRETRIFVAATPSGRQITIYENFVGVGGAAHKKKAALLGEKQGEEKALVLKNAMILPCPLKPGNEVRLLDLSKDGFEFQLLDQCFAKHKRSTSNCGGPSCAAAMEEHDRRLPVHQVGAYNISIAKSIPDLRRIDATTFIVPTNIEELMAKYYSSGFAFVICAFDATRSLKAHPVGYVHDPISQRHLFVPCRHEHGHGSEDLEQFDHHVYSLCTLADGGAGLTPAEAEQEVAEQKRRHGGNVIGATLSAQKVINKSAVLSELLQGPATAAVAPAVNAIRRAIIYGGHPNQDLTFRLIDVK